ncbi:stage V sporulation protein D [Numidum massiliense]|uniref:stage V sporulation protein D n=1 Tax=Numidum massiliense TaxID=1522315 RepID=UPI0006D55654|nr:stage V sporulation protein D [Numidum massiliense]
MRFSTVTVRKRIFFTFCVAVLFFAALVGRLAYVQLVQGEWLAEQADDLWSRNIPFEGKRGEILDRHGKRLAYNISAPSVMAVPSQVKDPKQTAETLATVLQADAKKIYKQLTKKEYIVRITPEGRKISEKLAREIYTRDLPGVYIAEDSKRHYPKGAFAAHVLGFTGIDNQGLSGLESVYDKKMRGTRGHVSFEAKASGEKIPGGIERFTPPKDGLTLKTTIDAELQAIMERELDQAQAQFQPEGIIAIAMDPKTGEVLAMASRPTYNPEKFRDYDPDIYNRNTPIWRTYEPGSTFKIITLAAALEEKAISLDDHFHDPGYIEVSGVHLHCWRRGGHGSETMLEVVQNSCNPGFVKMGQVLGEEKLFKYIRAFGFGDKTGIDLPGEATGILFKPEQVGPVELGTTSFGQGVSVTPLQQVAAVSSAVNGGKKVQPHVAKEWVHPETGKTVERVQLAQKKRVISEETSAKVRHALESVVAQGTGRRAFIDGYRMGGKTGTAQKVGPNGRYLENNHIVSFVGFAPADDPELVVYVAVDNPQGVQFGGVVSAPIVKRIMADSLRSLGVKPRKDQLEPEVLYPEQPLVEVPNLVNLKPSELQTSLYSFQLHAVGKGNRVVEQSPAPGTRVKQGATIRVYLGEETP